MSDGLATTWIIAGLFGGMAAAFYFVEICKIEAPVSAKVFGVVSGAALGPLVIAGLIAAALFLLLRETGRGALWWLRLGRRWLQRNRPADPPPPSEGAYR